MPTYEYKCLDCGRRFDVVQSMRDEPLTDCEECRGKLKRLIGAGAGVIFKGSGFYTTDYRSDSYRQAEKSDKASVTPSSSGTKESSTGDGAKSTSGGAKSTSGGEGKKSESKNKSGSAKGTKT